MDQSTSQPEVEAKNKHQLNTAYHEAGHCVAAIEVGLKFEYATIIPTHDYSGVVEGFDEFSAKFWTRLNNYENLTRVETSLIKKHTFVSLAGQAVDVRRGCYSELTVQQDNSVAIDLASILTNGDFDGVSHYIDTTLNRLAKIFLRKENWRKIEAIARELVEKKKLSYQDVLSIYYAS